MVRKIIGTFSTKLVSAAINFLIVIMTTQYLGTTGKGETSLIIANITLIQLLNNFVGGTALVYLTPRNKTFLLLIPSYVWAIISSGTGTSLLYYLGQIDAEVTVHIFLLSVIFSFFSIHQMVFMGKENIAWHNILSLLQIVVTVLALGYFFMIREEKTVESFIFSTYAAYGTSLFISSLVVLKYLNGFSLSGLKSSLKTIFSYGFIAQISSLITFFNNRLSYYLLKEWRGTDDVGVYSTGVSIIEATGNMLSKSIALVQYSKVANETDEKKSIQLTDSLTKLSFWAAFVIILVLLVIPPALYTYIFGRDFGEIHKVILTLSVGVLSLSFSTTFLHYFSGKGQYNIVNIATGIALVFTIGFAFLLMPTYGIIGAGITASIAHFVQSVYLYFKYRQISNFAIADLFKLKEEIELVKDWLNLNGNKD